MKISCQSCQAKYTIADEKVLGKIVKIRCKKCGATIVINGNEQEAATAAFDPNAGAAAQSPVYDYAAQGGGEPWTVNVTDGDQRTMTTADIAAAYRSGVVVDDTYCWKDGMGDWLPLRDIPELYTACAAGPQPTMNPDMGGGYDQQQPAYDQQPRQPAYDQQQYEHEGDDQPTQAAFSSLFGNGQEQQQPDTNGASLFGGAAAAAVASPAPAAARRSGGRGGADLFSGAAQAGSEEDQVMTSASASPQMAPGGDRMTGQRNENSVLFSLSALTANAPQEEKLPTAQGEGSGLIDIRALSQSMAADEGAGGKHVDDIMNLGGGGAFSAALAAPVLAPPPADLGDLSAQGGGKKSNTGLIVGIIGGLGLLGIIVAGGLYLALHGSSSATTDPASSVATATAAPTETTTATATAPATSVAAADTSDQAKPPDVGTTTGDAKEPTHTTTTHTTTAHTGGGTTHTGGTTTTTTTHTSGCAAGDFQCEMAKAAGAKGGGTTHSGGGGGGGGTAPFNIGAAAGSLGGISSSVGSCKRSGGPTGPGRVEVTFQPSGRVSTVSFIQGPYNGTSVGGCILGKFRGAHVPPFSGGPTPVKKSFVVN